MASKCQRCGSALDPGHTLGDQCPRCLFQIGVEPASSAESADPSMPGERIGPYTILTRLGEGGMGRVYLADQEEPIRRRVALKIIKPGMDSEQVIARFESERQALALMSHPGVARVFDAGVTARGRPYFAMEHVDGLPITEFCDKSRLGLAERLKLFVRVCEAIQHAHQKGVIHRDVKPSNVLVADAPEGPQVKVIDFGVAKATGGRLTESTLFTADGVLIGTPEYMSPEQAQSGGQVVDTRTDVYALGVLLYELVTGSLPFDGRQLRREGFEEILRCLREDDPPRPSARISTGGEAAGTAAHNRRTDPGTLVRRLRGDLDWIVLRALEKEPARRYPSPSELGADVLRFLADQPVEARPPSAAYRAGKFVRRHRIGVAATAALLVAIVTGALLASWQALRATRAEATARAEARTASEVSRFMVDLFEVSLPADRSPKQVTADELLRAGAERIDTELADQPRVRVRMLHVLGRVYERLGAHDDAIPLLEQALREGRRLDTEDAALTALLTDLALAYEDVDRSDEARELLQDALARQRAAAGPGSAGEATILSVASTVEKNVGEYEAARELLEQARAIRLRTDGPDSMELGKVLHNLGGVLRKLGRYDEAIETLERALAISEAHHGPEHYEVAADRVTLGVALMETGAAEEAWSQLTRAREVFERVLGPDSAEVLSASMNLGILAQQSGRLDEARRMQLEVLGIQERTRGPDHTSVAVTLINLGGTEIQLEDYTAARQHYSRAGEIIRAALGDEHPHLDYVDWGLANAADGEGRHDEARRLNQEVLGRQIERLGEEHLNVAISRLNLAANHLDLDRPAEALPLFEKAYATMDRDLEPDHPYLVAVCGGMADALVELQSYERAETMIRRAIEITERTVEDETAQLADLLATHAAVLEGRGDDEGSRRLLDRSEQIRGRLE